jgi:hypothetical protein
MDAHRTGGSNVNIAELERFYEKITLEAVTDTVAKLLTHPFGFHGDTGIQNYLYAQLLVRGGKALDFNDPQGRPGFSTLLLQAEHYTLVKYGKTGPTGGGRFDLALALPPESLDAIEDRFADNLRACFALELGKNKDFEKVIDPAMVGQPVDEIAGTSDVSKLYHELIHHGLTQGWAIEFYDSRVTNGASIISGALEILQNLEPIEGKKLVVVFIGFSPDGEHYVSSNDSDVQASLICTLGERHITAGSDLAAYSSKPTPPYQQSGWATSSPSASVDQVFGSRAAFANRIIAIGGVEESGRSSRYVNLSAGPKRNVAQLHPQEDGIALVLRSRDEGQPATAFAEIPVAGLAGYRGTNASWLDGAGPTFAKKGPAVAYLIPDAVDGLDGSDPAWRQVAELIAHAKASA